MNGVTEKKNWKPRFQTSLNQANQIKTLNYYRKKKKKKKKTPEISINSLNRLCTRKVTD